MTRRIRAVAWIVLVALAAYQAYANRYVVGPDGMSYLDLSDAIVGGHTHTEFPRVINGIPVMRGRSSGRGVAFVDLPVSRAARTDLTPRVVFVATDSIVPEPDITRIVDAAIAPIRELAAKPVATIAEDLRRAGAQYPLGNFVADAQRDAAGTDIAVMNNGGIRANLLAGPANYGAFFELSPFGNVLVRMSVTGAALRSYLERVVSRAQPNAHVSGLVMRYDPARSAGSRIIDVMIGGSPLDAVRTYTITMSDFMATGGDGLSLAGAGNPTDTGIVDLDAIVAYAQSRPGGVVRADPAVRIVSVPQ